jgi:hypothetical protein
MFNLRRFALGWVASAAVATASGLPPTTPTLDFTYATTPDYLSYSPGGANVSLFNSFLILYGTPSGGGSPSKLEMIDEGSADWCYGATCPSSTTNYPAPNYVFPVGSLNFIPTSIVPGTGISSVSLDFSVTGEMAPLGGPPPFYSISGDDKATLVTGVDPGGLTSFAYFINGDGSLTNVLHVTIGSSGADPILQGVLIDPPSTMIFDILGFEDPGPNGFLTPPLPEPGTGALLLLSGVLLAAAAATRRRPA